MLMDSCNRDEKGGFLLNVWQGCLKNGVTFTFKEAAFTRWIGGSGSDLKLFCRANVRRKNTTIYANLGLPFNGLREFSRDIVHPRRNPKASGVGVIAESPLLLLPAVFAISGHTLGGRIHLRAVGGFSPSRHRWELPQRRHFDAAVIRELEVQKHRFLRLRDFEGEQRLLLARPTSCRRSVGRDMATGAKAVAHSQGFLLGDKEYECATP